jgi:hypothetical protein
MENDEHDFEVTSEDIQLLLRRIGLRLKESMPDGWGFALFIFSHGKSGLKDEGEEGSIFYLSSANRKDMIKALKEFIKKEEKKHGHFP